MLIDVHTKISKILKQHPDALEAIISIHAKFEKLRNPLLRKIMAARTTIGQAASIGGVPPEKFFEKLTPLGFEVDHHASADIPDPLPAPTAFLKEVSPADTITLDVRPIIEAGEDPLSLITTHTKSLKKGAVLRIINTFEPTPLIALLAKQGFISYVERVSADEVVTYFQKKEDRPPVPDVPENKTEGWDRIAEAYKDRTRTVDVRHMEMPVPMMTILESLATLPDDAALHVYHKRIPVFLLPELKEKKFDYRIKELSGSEVHLLIFKEK